jgi:hypothetical protein
VAALSKAIPKEGWCKMMKKPPMSAKMPPKATGKKELPFFMKKDAPKTKAKPKKMMGGGSCK